MVVCSCNILTDGMIENFIRSAENGCKARDVYCGLGCIERCGHCAETIKSMIAAHNPLPAMREHDLNLNACEIAN